jgi:hypothetical protein
VVEAARPLDDGSIWKLDGVVQRIFGIIFAAGASVDQDIEVGHGGHSRHQPFAQLVVAAGVVHPGIAGIFEQSDDLRAVGIPQRLIIESGLFRHVVVRLRVAEHFGSAGLALADVLDQVGLDLGEVDISASRLWRLGQRRWSWQKQACQHQAGHGAHQPLASRLEHGQRLSPVGVRRLVRVSCANPDLAHRNCHA